MVHFSPIQSNTHIFKSFFFPEDRKRMEMWANQVPMCYPEFTACKLFTIDFTILSSLAATIATYLVVLMQL